MSGRWVVHEHTHGSTIHDRDCPHVTEDMPPSTHLRRASKAQVISFCRVAARTKFCRRCNKRTVD